MSARRDLDLNLLRAFAAVVEIGSVTAAARFLNRTQAAVSLQIKRLEEQLGQDLFERQHKKFVLTQAGELLVGLAQRLLAVNDEVWDRMTTPSFEGEVRLGVPVDIITTYVPPVLRRFNSNWPRVQVSIIAKNSHELIEDLEAGALDLALTTEIASERSGERLATEPLVWFGASGGSAHRSVPLPIAIGGRTCRFRPAALDALRTAGRDWRIVLQVPNQDAVNATVAAGLCVSILLKETVPAGLDVLAASAGLPPLPEFALNLHVPRTAHETAQELARHIRAEFAQRAILKGEAPSRAARRDSFRVSAAPLRGAAAGRLRRADRPRA